MAQIKLKSNFVFFLSSKKISECSVTPTHTGVLFSDISHSDNGNSFIKFLTEFIDSFSLRFDFDYLVFDTILQKDLLLVWEGAKLIIVQKEVLFFTGEFYFDLNWIFVWVIVLCFKLIIVDGEGKSFFSIQSRARVALKIDLSSNFIPCL